MPSTPNLRRCLAATGATTILATLGAFAAMFPANASPAEVFPTTNNAGHVAAYHASVGDETANLMAGVDSIDAATFNEHTNGEYSDESCGTAYDGNQPVKYCEFFTDEMENGTSWDAYIAVPNGTTFDAALEVDHPDSSGGEWHLTQTIHSDSQYVHLHAGISQWTETDVQSHVHLTLSDGSVYDGGSRMSLDNGRYDGRVYLSPA
ncbi:MAG: hypothetical protein QM747_19250 [Nocardioides sp.]